MSVEGLSVETVANCGSCLLMIFPPFVASQIIQRKQNVLVNINSEKAIKCTRNGNFETIAVTEIYEIFVSVYFLS
jgi:hypothetical protein